MKLIKTTLLTAAALAFSVHAAVAASTQVSPADIPITLFYHGVPVEIKGQAAPGEDVLIKITPSEQKEFHLKYKGKAVGIFWMKLGTLVFKNLPSTYLLASSAPVEKVLDAASQDAENAGFAALQKKAEIKAEKGNMPAGDWFGQFLDFKKKEKLYAVQEGAVKVDANGSYQVTLAWPFQAPPGSYKVETITAKNGQVTGRSEAAIKVELTGIVALLAKMSSDNRVLYGILSIVVALAAGFGVGMIFRKGGGGSH
jgi:uncharacterized protein (TIGR02186 family)